jgi:enoyl-CoA hydratase/carnithine racemase
VSVDVTVDGAVAVVTLNRPERLNAIDPATAVAMAETVERIEADPALRVAVLTGAGERAFSAGADLKASADEGTVHDPEHGFGGFVAHERAKPWIAAVNGLAVGGGLEFALACDVIVAADHARFGFPEVTIGVIAGAGGLFRFPRAVGFYPAMELMLTGELFDSARARELGLLNHVVPGPDVMSTALDVARKIARNAPVSAALTRRVIRDTWGQTDERCWEISGEASDVVLGSEDAAEGTRAFVEKRAPVWTGR